MEVTFPDVCRCCGRTFRLEVLEVWGWRDFMLDACCEGTQDEAMEWLRDEQDGADLLRALGIEWLTAGCGGLRRVVDDGGTLRLDWNIQVRLIRRGDAFGQAAVRRFIERHHGHARNCNAAWRFGGTVWNGRLLLGVVWVGNPVSRVLMHRHPGMVEVNRLCLDLDASDKLRYRAASAAYQWAAEEAERRGFTGIQTYTLASESGMSLRYARWRVLDEDAGGTSWHSATRTRPNATAPGRKVRWGKRLHPTVPAPCFRPRSTGVFEQMTLALEAA